MVFYEQSDNLTVYKCAYKLHERIRYFFNKKETELYSYIPVTRTRHITGITFIRYAQSKSIIKHDSHNISTISFLNLLILLIGYFFG